MWKLFEKLFRKKRKQEPSISLASYYDEDLLNELKEDARQRRMSIADEWAQAMSQINRIGEPVKFIRGGPTITAAEDKEETMEPQERTALDAIKPYIDYDGQDVWRCGKCGNSLMHPSYYESDEDAKNHIRYCSHCGQAVKWDG